MLFEPDLLIASLKDVVMALEDRKVSSEQLVTDYLSPCRCVAKFILADNVQDEFRKIT